VNVDGQRICFLHTKSECGVLDRPFITPGKNSTVETKFKEFSTSLLNQFVRNCWLCQNIGIAGQLSGRALAPNRVSLGSNPGDGRLLLCVCELLTSIVAQKP